MVKESPNSAYAHYTLAQYYGLTKELEKALKHYKVAYDLKQFNSEMTASLLNAMSESLLKLTRYKEARENCIKSISKKPVQAGGYYLLYKISMEEGRDEEAVEWLQKLLSMTEKLQFKKKTLSTDILIDRDKIMFTLGCLYDKVGELDEALKCLEEVYRRKTENTSLLNRLVDVCVKKGNYQLAEKYLKHLINLTDGDLRYMNTLGIILIKQEKFQEAISIYESILSKIPENIDSIKRLIGLYGKIGEMQKAGELVAAIQEVSYS